MSSCTIAPGLGTVRVSISMCSICLPCPVRGRLAMNSFGTQSAGRPTIQCTFACLHTSIQGATTKALPGLLIQEMREVALCSCTTPQRMIAQEKRAQNETRRCGTSSAPLARAIGGEHRSPRAALQETRPNQTSDPIFHRYFLFPDRDQRRSSSYSLHIP
jgi:hypothetical protein